ncbi:MAG: phosphate transport system substrate-binding protein [Verrucomicrobiota bacterium]|jgi:phosphate transport system substrate-binding protein
MKNLLKKIIVAAATVATVASTQAGNITVKGSDTLVILAQKWAETYMSKHPEVKIQVTGGGSGIGFAALQNKTTDIADASRPIKTAERAACIKAFGKTPLEYKVALDGLSVYVNESSPINELDLDQLEKIFTGKVKNWKEIGGPDAPITVYSRENSSGTYEFFKEHVLKGHDFVSSAQTMPGTAALLQAVSKDKGGIGYGGAAYGHGAKALKIKKTADSPAIEATEENVVSGKYPIWRYLYNYLDAAKDKGEIAAYLNWIRSEEGQKIVKDVGYYPLPANLQEK